jgi:thiosulfate/3-mercaptopyruvate sulfurtransferase
VFWRRLAGGRVLGRDEVKNYDGSWTEWGDMVAVPIEKK